VTAIPPGLAGSRAMYSVSRIRALSSATRRSVPTQMGEP
jgi:hypothetical protein